MSLCFFGSETSSEMIDSKHFMIAFLETLCFMTEWDFYVCMLILKWTYPSLLWAVPLIIYRCSNWSISDWIINSADCMDVQTDKSALVAKANKKAAIRLKANQAFYSLHLDHRAFKGSIIEYVWFTSFKFFLGFKNRNGAIFTPTSRGWPGGPRQPCFH